MYHWYRWVMATTEKRPRIKPWVAERVDRTRGQDSFEAHVEHLLDRALGRYWVAPDPMQAKRYTVIGDEETIVAMGLTKRDADWLATDLGLVDSAYNQLSSLYESLEAVGDEHAEIAEELAEQIGRLGDALKAAHRSPSDA